MLMYAKMGAFVVMMDLKGAMNAFVYLDFMAITVRYVSRVPNVIYAFFNKSFKIQQLTRFIYYISKN